MKRRLKPEELRIWGLVAATVHPLPGRETPTSGLASDQSADPPLRTPVSHSTRTAKIGARQTVDVIEPGRKHRIARERDPISARLDLHGLDQDRARAALESFLRRAWDEGFRAVLVITGKGIQGDGILRRRTPEWLAATHLEPIVAGISEAHRRHGGEGALYVALKRKPRG